MENTIKDLRKFILREMIKSEWSTEGRKDYYSTKYVSIKRNFDTNLWQFNLNGTDNKYYDFKSIGINKIFLYILFIFIKRSIKKQSVVRKNEVLVNTWKSFLKNNKEINRDSKIDKLIN